MYNSTKDKHKHTIDRMSRQINCAKQWRWIIRNTHIYWIASFSTYNFVIFRWYFFGIRKRNLVLVASMTRLRIFFFFFLWQIILYCGLYFIQFCLLYYCTNLIFVCYYGAFFKNMYTVFFLYRSGVILIVHFKIYDGIK